MEYYLTGVKRIFDVKNDAITLGGWFKIEVPKND